jgi:hypothetical protein
MSPYLIPVSPSSRVIAKLIACSATPRAQSAVIDFIIGRKRKSKIMRKAKMKRMKILNFVIGFIFFFVLRRFRIVAPRYYHFIQARA